MNNSQLPIEEPVSEDRLALLRERQAELVRTIETLLGVAETENWKKLKELIFDKEVSRLESRLYKEARAVEINTPNLYRLQAQIVWSKKHTDLEKMAQTFKVELENIKKILNG
jgi:hypothetical protein